MPRLTLRTQEKITGGLFILPTLIGLGAVVLAPLLWSLIVSFSDYTFIKPVISQFVWVQNYIAALKSEYFWNSLWVTLRFVVFVVGIEFALGFGIALLINRDIRFKGLYYTILTVPMVMSPVAVGLIWKMLVHPELGIINYILSLVGIPGIDWLGTARNAFWSLIMVDIWQQISFMILVLLAGLVSLPREPYEAARIDGAGALQQFSSITFPLMKPVMATAILIRVIFAFRTYDLVYVMTKGGPGASTDVLSYYIYRRTFMGLNLAEASAISYILLIIVLLMVLLLFRYVKGLEEI